MYNKKHAGFLGRALHLWKIPSTTPKSGEAQDDPLPSISAPATLGPGHAKF